jgi:hypothetical protein
MIGDIPRNSLANGAEPFVDNVVHGGKDVFVPPVDLNGGVAADAQQLHQILQLKVFFRRQARVPPDPFVNRSEIAAQRGLRASLVPARRLPDSLLIRQQGKETFPGGSNGIRSPGGEPRAPLPLLPSLLLRDFSPLEQHSFPLRLSRPRAFLGKRPRSDIHSPGWITFPGHAIFPPSLFLFTKSS